MKIKSILIGVISGIVALSSCKKDIIEEQQKDMTIPVFTNPADAESYVLDSLNKKGSFETYIWSEAYFKGGDDIVYTLELDTAGGEFITPIVLKEGTSDLFQSVIIEEMNQKLKELGNYPGYVEASQIRVKSKQGSEILISNPISLLTNRFRYKDEVSSWSIYGTATSGKNLMMIYDADAKLWSLTTDLVKGVYNFKDAILPNKNFGTIDGDVFSLGGASIVIPEDSEYTITLDDENRLVTLVNDGRTPIWNVFGSAIGGDDLMIMDKNDDGSWSKDLDLSVGVFKFKDSSKNQTILGSNGTEGELVENGTDIVVETGGVFKITISADASTYSIENAYPSTMNMIGDAVGGWNWGENDVAMVPVNGMPHIFWKVVWLDGNKGYKFNPDTGWDGRDFTCINGVGKGIFDIGGGDNMTSPTESGYYMVVVDLVKKQVSVDDTDVYIGGGSSSWDFNDPTLKFSTVDGTKTMTVTKDLNDGNIRMCAKSPWISDWWRAEFQVFSGKIEYRGNGGDQAEVTVTAGSNTVTLNFNDETGSIALN